MIPAESDPSDGDGEKAARLERSRGDGTADRPVAGSTGTGQAAETETPDRDALHQADYGGAREPTVVPASPEEDQQGGLSADDAAGGGRKPTGDRDRDYDPDGDRAGL